MTDTACGLLNTAGETLAGSVYTAFVHDSIGLRLRRKDGEA
jgi:hypothetical protein